MIYLDNSATTMPDERVLASFNKASLEYFANSNSIHSLGMRSKKLENYATDKIKEILNIRSQDIIYTSGASEANNHVLKGICSKYQNRGNHIITTYLEHASIKTTLRYLENKGFIIDYVKILDDGTIDLEHLKQLLNNNTILVAISYVDSELGIRQPIEEISKLVRAYPKCFLHVDCTQALGKIKIDFNLMDFASASAHKIFGLKGIGLLIKKKEIIIDNLIHGGKSTTEFRSGTPALPLIVSFMKAIELIVPNIDKNYSYVATLNKQICDKLKNIEGISINSTNKSIPYIINLSINNIKPETFVHSLDLHDIYISTKSACSSEDSISDSVYAITKNREKALKSIRISMSYQTTKEEIEIFLNYFIEEYNKLSLK